VSKAKLRENRGSNFSYVGGERMYFMTKEGSSRTEERKKENERNFFNCD
jgi:hypothetical protein